MNLSAPLASVRAEMARQGKSQKELAHHLNMSAPWVSNLLSGKAEIKLATFLEIATWLDIPASELMATPVEQQKLAA